MDKGYAAVRMGSNVAEPQAVDNPLIVDYASDGWSEERDLYLASRCRIFVATTSGIADFGRSPGRPAPMCQL